MAVGTETGWGPTTWERGRLRPPGLSLSREETSLEGYCGSTLPWTESRAIQNGSKLSKLPKQTLQNRKAQGSMQPPEVPLELR
jgi:hypothetical protein